MTHNYTCCSAYYVEVISLIDTFYPGLKVSLSLKVLFIKVLDQYPLRRTINQRRKQIIKCDRKTGGSIRNVACHLYWRGAWKVNTILYKDFYDGI